jgi:DNA repair exonuclease SbcCD ATPase subunit
MTQLIQVPAIGQTPQIAINPEGEKLKLELIAVSREVIFVTTDSGRDIAIQTAASIKAHLASVEKERVAIKEPFLTAGRAIDAAAKAHVTELETELRRLNNLAGAYEAEKQRLAHIAEQQRAAEEARLTREKAAAEREAARLAEEARKKEEAAAAKGRKLTDQQKAKQMEEQMEAAEKAEAAEAEERRIATERSIAAQQQAESKPTGASLRTELEVTVTDIRALYAKEPACVKLTADISMIKAFHKAGRELPGVTITERPVFATRASR